MRFYYLNLFKNKTQLFKNQFIKNNYHVVVDSLKTRLVSIISVV